MVWPDVRFVDAPDEDATVLLNLNDPGPAGGGAARRVCAEGFTLGAPSLEGDPDAIEPLYGPRTITVPLEVAGTKAQTVSLLADIARLVITGYRPTFAPALWLRVQFSSLHLPVWFRLLRPEPEDVSWERVYVDNPEVKWDLSLTLPAEAFGYGALESFPAQTIYYDPTALSNQLCMNLGEVKGDAPTYLRVETVSSDTVSTGNYQGLLVAHAATTEPMGIDVPVGDVDGWSTFSGTSTSASDITAIGGANRTTTFGTPEMALRLRKTITGVPPGRYKVLHRLKSPDPDDAVARFYFEIDRTVEGPVVSSGELGYSWRDLGNFWLPSRLPESFAGFANAEVEIQLLGELVEGAGTFAFDHFLLIPLVLGDTRESRAIYGSVTMNTNMTAVFDGDAGDAWAYDTTSGALGSGINAASLGEGVFPRAIPGVHNKLWLIPQTGSNMGGNDKNDSSTVVVRYYPRYLNLPAA